MCGKGTNEEEGKTNEEELILHIRNAAISLFIVYLRQRISGNLRPPLLPFAKLIAPQTTHHSHSDTAQSPRSRPASSDASLRCRRSSKALRKRAVFWNQTARRSNLKLLFLNQTARTSKALRKCAVFWV
ncbi:hypothetical protein ACOSQ4_022309 [Xanthoceras sorbifolium]